MKVRIITGLLMAAGAILLLTLAPPVWTYVLIQAAALLAADEFCRITLPGGRPLDRYAAILALGVVVAVAYFAPDHVLTVMAISVPILLSVVLFSEGDVERMAQRAGLLVCGYAYLGLALVSLTMVLVRGPELVGRPPHGQDGPLLVLALFAAVFAGDSGAFFAGKFLGERKLYPKVSPKKTWAGSYGGAASSVLGFLLIEGLAGLGIPLHHSLLLGLCCGVSGQAGDLAESMFKRAYGVKDSGTLIPGHGGILDRVDGVLFAAPVMWVYLSYAV